MPRPTLEVADIFRDHGPAWRDANRGHVSLGQLKVMSAIERCRTAALGGHVLRCEKDACGHTAIAYNSCRNRHCPKCQSAAAREWMAARATELLPVPYFHVVFTVPAAIGDIAYQNKAVIYDLLLRASAETMLTIAADSFLVDNRMVRGLLETAKTRPRFLTSENGKPCTSTSV
jgi:Transposase zinc-binding domain